MPFRKRMPAWKTATAKANRKTPTPAEARLWVALRGSSRPRWRTTGGKRFRRQAPMLGYIADFYCPSAKLVVEVDGGFHDGREAYDAQRDERMRAYGLRVLRFTNEQVLTQTASVVTTILAAL